jgi:hypothetical protein
MIIVGVKGHTGVSMLKPQVMVKLPGVSVGFMTVAAHIWFLVFVSRHHDDDGMDVV